LNLIYGKIFWKNQLIEVLMMNLNNKIKRLRQENNWSQERLGQKVGVNRLIIGKYERGQAIPSTETLQKLSEVFGVSIDYLLSDNNNKNLANVAIKDKTLLEYFEEIDRMDEGVKDSVKFFLDAIILKHKMKEMVGEKK
jgi:transcriptional regulator with XRE-family HTH domain